MMENGSRNPFDESSVAVVAGYANGWPSLNLQSNQEANHMKNNQAHGLSLPIFPGGKTKGDSL